MNLQRQRIVSAVVAAVLPLAASASSHREAPFITTRPKVDATDLYMFNSYEAGRSGYVTLIANYQPFENPQGGPNYYTMDPNALYEILIDNNGSGHEALTFQFRFTTVDAGLTVTAGKKAIPVPLTNIGPVDATNTAAQNVAETYTVTLMGGDRRSGTARAVVDATTGSKTFTKPLDNIGAKSIADYAAYAGAFVHTINIPGCSTPGKVFVGQRQDPFVVNLGETFDLVNIKYPVEELAPAGVNARNLAPNSLAGYNVTSIALEIPTGCLTSGSDPVIGAWTTASLRQSAVLNPLPQSAYSVNSVGAVVGPTFAAVEGGAWSQVSRLGMPLVNELVIGLPDKDRFNASAPKDDAQFADYVTNPSLPVLLQALFGSAGVLAPNVYPRSDLIAAFLTGLKGLNQPKSVTPAEELRLNTSIPATPVASQNDLGVLGGDTGGFPNGRRPIDDVVDIELRVAMGVLLSPFNGSAQDPDPASDASRQLHYTDGAEPNPANYLPVFPYLNTALAGSPTSAND
ncbi:MAG TPA: DUF4331 domain-containing protein [Steroidobacteraceae bacterium]|jgi:hypothetical protein|nr:DUF4331 domain-containing protein [Steroidobacteraceae bacterium]